MKKQINFLLMVCLGVSLLLPLQTLAQTGAPPPMKLTLEDSTGNRISTPGIKGFGIGDDNNLVVLLDQPFNFTDLLPDILLASCVGCTIAGPASVTATQGANLSFNVQSSQTTAVISLVAASSEIGFPLPVLTSTNGSAPFSWNTGTTPPGSYLAVFQALDGTQKSQLPVVIKIVPPGYTLTVSAQGCAGSSVTKSPDSPTYDPSSPVTVTLTPILGFGCSFSSWGGDLSGSTNPGSIVMSGNKNVTANFISAPSGYGLTANVNPAGAGTVVPTPASGPYTPNSFVDLVATANSGWTLSSWDGLANGDTSSVSAGTARVYMSQNRTITATFTQGGPTQCSFTVSVNPATGGTVSNTGGTYACGISVPVTATPNSGYNFGSWSGLGAGDTSSGNSATILMSGTKSITANFSSQVTPSGENLPYFTYTMVWVNAGEEKVYIVNIDKPLIYLNFGISGLTYDTSANFTWTFPDGRVFPQSSNQGLSRIYSMDGSGTLVLRTKKYFSPNFQEDYIPVGRHVISIKGIAPQSYLKLGVYDAN